MSNSVRFDKFGTMLDCSRNAVLKVDTVKKWIDISSDIGYNFVSLYIEDTYEVENQPYFGHWRGRYSIAELDEIDKYAKSKNMEFIPCIQVLAHLNAIFHWREYDAVRDCDDILLVDEDKTYSLIESMFKTFSKVMSGRTINIGMDEAHFLGLGKYLDKYGYQERTKILTNHLAKVAEMAKKYDFKLLMWGDMFVRLINGGEYFVTDFTVPEEIKKSIPDNVDIIYWDYYSVDRKRYDNQIKAHSAIKENIWFAGGLWTWTGFAPHNDFSIRATDSALKACDENEVKNILLTMWGDNGAECSKFAALPSLYYSAEIAKGNYAADKIKEGFLKKYGIPFDDFMYLDLPGTGNDSPEDIYNPDKYMLYCDCFMGQYDYTVREGGAEAYKKCSERLALYENNEEYGYLFSTIKALSDVLAIKYDIGVRTRKAYLEKDNDELEKLVLDYEKLAELVDKFYFAARTQWMKENKPHGFDVLDIRLGGLSRRITHCKERLEAFVNGTLERIDELEEPVLNFKGSESDDTSDTIAMTWSRIASVNVI